MCDGSLSALTRKELLREYLTDLIELLEQETDCGIRCSPLQKGHGDNMTHVIVLVNA